MKSIMTVVIAALTLCLTAACGRTGPQYSASEPKKDLVLYCDGNSAVRHTAERMSKLFGADLREAGAAHDGTAAYEVIYLGLPAWDDSVRALVDSLIEGGVFGTSRVVPFTTLGDSTLFTACAALKAAYPAVEWLAGHRLDGSGDEELLAMSPQRVVAPGGREFVVNGVSFTMVPVDGGTFMMGATGEQQDVAQERERPAHRVTLSPYWIGQTAVTQALWKAVTGTNPSSFSEEEGYADWARRPVEMVSYNDCMTFIEKLNELTSAQFRLPTEAEWEFAARGGVNGMGYRFSGGNDPERVAWQRAKKGTSDFCTHAVATKVSNELGLYDMSGNVWEWCSDWYGPYGREATTDPTGPETGTKHVYRGGCWSDWHEKNCRVSCRHFNDADSAYVCLGLRLAM